jgi:hypothetical protein
MSVCAAPAREESAPLDGARLEALRQAMSGEVVNQALSDGWNWARRKDYRVLDCQLVRVYPRRNQEFVLEYRVQLAGLKGVHEQVLLAELVGESAAARCAASIASLCKRRRRQLSRHDYLDKVDSLNELGLVIRLPGLDERLPGLKLYHRPALAAPLLESAGLMPADDAGDIRARMLGHRLGRRGIARFEFASAGGEPGDTATVIAKFYKANTGRGDVVARCMDDLRRAGFDGVEGMAVPRPLAWDTQWRVLLMEDVPATPLPELSGQPLADGLAGAGRVLRHLHGSRVPVAGLHTVDDEMALLAEWVALLGAVFPSCRAAAREALARVNAAFTACQPADPVVAHRDFYEKQTLVNGTTTYLIDFDTLTLADPALDVANFLAHVRLADKQQGWGMAGAEQLFLEGYGTPPDRSFDARVVAYTRASLLRLACLHAFWPRWQGVVAPLLEAVAGND